MLHVVTHVSYDLGGRLSAPADGSTRVTSNGPYRTPAGALVANSKADLLDGSLLHAIDATEFGSIDPLREVWTGTTSTA